MITHVYSARHKKRVYLLDVRANGKRIRRFFLKKGDAETLHYKIKHDAVTKRYGLPTLAEHPTLADLIEKRLATITNKREHTRAKRVLSDLLSLLPKGYCVDEVTKADIQKYVDKRGRDGLKPQSIDRELNIISATLNSTDTHYPSLDQWRPPKMPRPKIVGGRRERVWSEDEIKAVLGELFAARRKGEQEKATVARYRVGRRVQFCLLTGLRHGEMLLIRKSDVNWKAKTVRVYQGKTGAFKTIGPLGPSAMEIIREFNDASTSDLVFSRSGNIIPRFYRILREACQRAGVPYGKDTAGGLVLHDARHTATTHLLESGVSPATIREWMGWSEASFVLYYSHATKKSRELAGKSLEQLAG